MDIKNEKFWEGLEAKYPCPTELEAFKHMLYKPMAIIGWMNKKYLINKGEKETGFFGRKASAKAC